jgi:hypothetical protein
MQGLLDDEDKPIDAMSAIYDTEPNESWSRGLLNFFGADVSPYSQPYFFGEDASNYMGGSSDYPRFRTEEDENRYKGLMPKKSMFITSAGYKSTGQGKYDVAWDDGGTFDELAYDHAMTKFEEEYPNRERHHWKSYYGGQ